MVAVEDVGAIGFVLANPIADLFGLNDERSTHLIWVRRKLSYVYDS
jgi:hypothetical protein